MENGNYNIEFIKFESIESYIKKNKIFVLKESLNYQCSELHIRTLIESMEEQINGLTEYKNNGKNRKLNDIGQEM